jgi:OmpA family
MSDVLFDTAKYTLKPEAREKLSKVSGILLAYPNLKVQVEGYTDNIDGDQYNLTLSQQRGDAVRTYLVSQAVSVDNITATGYGMNNPIADNATPAGRAQNRRVQMVVSGSAIGVQQTQPSAAPRPHLVPPPGHRGPSAGALRLGSPHPHLVGALPRCEILILVIIPVTLLAQGKRNRGCPAITRIADRRLPSSPDHLP